MGRSILQSGPIGSSPLFRLGGSTFLVMLLLSGCKLQSLPGAGGTSSAELREIASRSKAPKPISEELGGNGQVGADGVQIVRASGFRLSLRALNENPVNLKSVEVSSSLGAKQTLDFEVVAQPNFGGELEVDVRVPEREAELLGRAGAKETILFGIYTDPNAKPAVSAIDGTSLSRFSAAKSFRIEPEKRHVFRIAYSVLPNAPIFEQFPLLVSVTEVSKEKVRQRSLVSLFISVEPTLELQVRTVTTSAGSSSIIAFPGRDERESASLLRAGTATSDGPATSHLRSFRSGLVVKFKNFTTSAHQLVLGGALKSLNSNTAVLALSAGTASVPTTTERTLEGAASAADGDFRFRGEATSAARILTFNDSGAGTGVLLQLPAAVPSASPSPTASSTSTPRPTPTGTSTPIATPSPSASPAGPAAAKFSAVAALNSQYCLSCHRQLAPTLGTYAEILKIVTPGSPSASAYYNSISAGRMPLGKTMTTAEKEAIRSWIADGAKNN